MNGDIAVYGETSFLSCCLKQYGKKQGKKVFEAINDCFDHLPLAAIVDDQIFCVHGGIPRFVFFKTETNPQLFNKNKQKNLCDFSQYFT